MPIGDTTPRATDSYGVILPCQQDQFASFISGLLAKPQVIEKSIAGSFDLEHNDIESFFHLVDQRIREQQEASLIQFCVKVFYSDGSSVTHADLSGFRGYNEIRPEVAVACELSWVYLVKFPNTPHPQKQEIDVQISTGIEHLDWEQRRALYNRTDLDAAFVEAGMSFRIRHTNWTWGSDISSMLSHHMNSIGVRESGWISWLREKIHGISFWLPILLFAIAIAVVFLQAKSIATSTVDPAKNTAQDVVSQSNPVPEHEDRQGPVNLETHVIGALVFLCSAGLMALVTNVALVRFMPDEPPSFLRLSNASETHRRKVLKRQRKSMILFAITLIVTLGTGVAANGIYGWIAHALRLYQ